MHLRSLIHFKEDKYTDIHIQILMLKDKDKENTLKVVGKKDK